MQKNATIVAMVGRTSGSKRTAVAIAMLAIIYVIDIIATYFLIPEKKGAALE